MQVNVNCILYTKNFGHFIEKFDHRKFVGGEMFFIKKLILVTAVIHFLFAYLG